MCGELVWRERERGAARERERALRVSQSASAGDESSVRGREVYFVMLENI